MTILHITADIKVWNLHSGYIWDWLYDLCIDIAMRWLTKIDIGLTPLCFSLAPEIKSHLQGWCYFIKHAVHFRQWLSHQSAISVLELSDGHLGAKHTQSHTTRIAIFMWISVHASCYVSLSLLSVLYHLAFYQHLADWNALCQEYPCWEIWQNLCHGSRPLNELTDKNFETLRMASIF